MIEEALNHCDRDNTPPDSAATPTLREVPSTAQQSRSFTTWLSTPTTISQSTSTVTTMTASTSVRGNTAAGVGEESQPTPPTKTIWGNVNKTVTSRKPPHPPTGTTTVTTTTQSVMTTSTVSKWRPRKPSEPTKPDKQVPHSPLSSTLTCPPQASSYSDVASGMKPKTLPSPVMYPSSQQTHPGHTLSSQNKQVDTPPPTPLSSAGLTPTQDTPSKSPSILSEETPCPVSNLSAPASSPGVHKVSAQNRQHHRSVSDPSGSQASPKKRVETVSDVSSLTGRTIGSLSDRVSGEATPPRVEEDSKSLPPSSPLPLLGDVDHTTPPPSGLLMQSDHSMPLSLPPSLHLPTVMESPSMETKVGQYGPIGAPRHTVSDGDGGTGLGIPHADTSKQKKSSYGNCCTLSDPARVVLFTIPLHSPSWSSGRGQPRWLPARLCTSC